MNLVERPHDFGREIIYVIRPLDTTSCVATEAAPIRLLQFLQLRHRQRKEVPRDCTMRKTRRRLMLLLLRLP